MGNNPWVNFHPMLTFGNTVSFSKARPFAQVTQIFTIHVVRLGPGVVGPCVDVSGEIPCISSVAAGFHIPNPW